MKPTRVQGLTASSADPSNKVAWPGLDMDADAFAALVRHELNNPLNAMSGWLHLLSASQDLRSEIAARALEGARRAVDQQIEQIGLLSRVLQLTGSQSVLRTGLNSLESLSTAWESAVCAAAQRCNRAVQWRHAVDLDLGLVLLTDMAALGMAIVQLARPALRHGVEGASLEVDLSANDGDICLRLGIEAGDPPASSLWYLLGAEDASSLTLELLHARLVVQAHGGQLIGAPDAQGGSVMQIRLPLAQDVAMNRAASQPDGAAH